jgi:TolB-like protein/DNA-binding winged helix-turn-helix (wHTH) protein/Tfp pilus assembly protein PilF
MNTPNYRAGDLLIDTGRQRLTRDGAAISLPKLSYDLLLVLVRAAPNLVSLDSLMEQVWLKAVVSPETVIQRIKLLRDALGDDPRSPRYIEGLRGRGYRLISTVESIAEVSTEVSTSDLPTVADKTSAAVADSVAGPTVSTPSPHPAPRRWRVWAGGTALAVIVGLCVIYGVEHGRGKVRTSVEVVAVAPRAVAVLPFDNLSLEPNNDYIALGMADSVLHQLSSLPELVVIARSSSFALGRPAPDAREAGRRLGVRYLVEGSVQRAGSTLRVTAQLIDTTTNSQLWSLRVDRTVDDLFQIQDQIAQQVARELDVTLHGRSAEYARYGTDAYLALLKGRALLESRKVEDLKESIRQFSHAIELAPSFAVAFAELARAKVQLASVSDNPEDAKKVQLQVNELLNHAIQIDPNDGDAYFLRAQGRIESDVSGAEADFQKGLELAPNFGPGLRFYAYYLFDRGRYEDALAVIDRARLVDPLAAENHYFKGEIMRLGLRRPDEAAALYLQALAVVPDFYPAYTRLAQVRFAQGRLAEAIEYAEKAVAIEPTVLWVRRRVVLFYVEIGDLKAAQDALRGQDSDQISTEEALISYRAGDAQRAELLLRKAAGSFDFNGGGLSLDLATEAVVARAVETHSPETGRRFIFSLPDLKKDRGTVAVVPDNLSVALQLATVEHFTGDRALADDLATRTLEFFDHGGHSPAPALADEMYRAWALAVLGRTDAALLHLENLSRSAKYVGWWARIEHNPAFAPLRASPRFQEISAEYRVWLQGQTKQLAKMVADGEVPRRPANR